MYKAILTTTDGSPESEMAAEVAVHLTREFNAELTVLHVMDVRIPPGMQVSTTVDRNELRETLESLDISPEAIPSDIHLNLSIPGIDFVEMLKNAEIEYLKRIKKSARKEGINIKTRLRVGTPVEEILKETIGGDYDLTIISAYGTGRDELRGEEIGSVAETVARRSPCSVLIVRKLSRPPGDVIHGSFFSQKGSSKSLSGKIGRSPGAL